MDGMITFNNEIYRVWKATIALITSLEDNIFQEVFVENLV